MKKATKSGNRKLRKIRKTRPRNQNKKLINRIQKQIPKTLLWMKVKLTQASLKIQIKNRNQNKKKLKNNKNKK